MPVPKNPTSFMGGSVNRARLGEAVGNFLGTWMAWIIIAVIGIIWLMFKLGCIEINAPGTEKKIGAEYHELNPHHQRCGRNGGGIWDQK